MCCCCEKVVVKSEKAPKALGPYSVAVVAGDFVFTAGQIGLNPETNTMVEGGVEAETRQAMTNLKNVLEDAGSSLAQVVKSTIFLRDMNDFPKVNSIYGEFFTEDFPARSTVQVAALPKGAAVEIEMVALLICEGGCCCEGDEGCEDGECQCGKAQE